MRIQGISGSRGVAVGNVYRYIQEEIVIPDYTVAEDKVEEEIGKFAAAMAATLKQLDTIRQKALDEMGPEEAAIFEAHMQIAQDPSLSDGIKSLVESSHTNVVAATAQTIETFANIFLGMEDAYMRNRIRNHVIPYFKENINEKTVEHMNRSMDQLREIWDYMERQTESAYQICTAQNGEKICIHAEAYHRQERLIRKMILRKALALVAEHEKDLEQVHVEKLEGLFEKQVGKRLDLPYAVCACRTYEGIELKRKKKDTELAEEEKNLDLKQVSGKISYGKWEISYRIFEKEECRCQIPKKTYTKWFDYGIIKQSVAVRTRRAGDFIVIDGSGGRQKLKSYFINKKIPVAERTGIPLIAEGSEILWIVGCRQSKAYQVTEQTTKILEITINGGTLNGRESENVNSGRRSKCQN